MSKLSEIPRCARKSQRRSTQKLLRTPNLSLVLSTERKTESAMRRNVLSWRIYRAKRPNGCLFLKTDRSSRAKKLAQVFRKTNCFRGIQEIDTYQLISSWERANISSTHVSRQKKNPRKCAQTTNPLHATRNSQSAARSLVLDVQVQTVHLSSLPPPWTARSSNILRVTRKAQTNQKVALALPHGTASQQQHATGSWNYIYTSSSCSLKEAWVQLSFHSIKVELSSNLWPEKPQTLALQVSKGIAE